MHTRARYSGRYGVAGAMAREVVAINVAEGATDWVLVKGGASQSTAKDVNRLCRSMTLRLASDLCRILAVEAVIGSCRCGRACLEKQEGRPGHSCYSSWLSVILRCQNWKSLNSPLVLHFYDCVQWSPPRRTTPVLSSFRLSFVFHRPPPFCLQVLHDLKA